MKNFLISCSLENNLIDQTIVTFCMASDCFAHLSVLRFGSNSFCALWYTLQSVLGIFSATTTNASTLQTVIVI